MKKRLKILAPIDFSDCSENALKYAIQLADRIDATLEILHVPSTDILPLDYPSFVAVSTEEKISMSRTMLNKTIKKIRKEVSPLLDNFPDIQTDIEIGIPATKIIDVALRDQVDYIVMGTQGQNSVWDRFLGSTALGVLKYSPCPMFVIPEKGEYNEGMSLGYATDFSAADPYEIWKACNLLQPFHANIKAVHLSEREEYTKDKVDELVEFFSENAPRIDIQFFSFFSDYMTKDLNEFINDQNINLMVLYKPKRNFFNRLFHKSFTKDMIRHAEVPLLILK